MTLPSLGEIKERKLVQWGLAYLGGAWLVLQVVSVLGATYRWPEGLLRAVPVVLAVGFLVALVVAWYHGEKGAQKVSGPELAILAGLLGVAGLGVMLVGGGADAVAEADGAETAVVGLPGPEVEQTAIAVLPFESIGGDGVFAAGLTDQVHQTLSLIPELRVTAQTSAGAFRDADVSADSIGRALGVAHLVEGTVRTVGDKVRIAARLVDAESGVQEWSKTYDRDVVDIFAVQEEIARAVALELRVEVGSAVLLGQAPSDPEVFALVVRARQLMARGGDDFFGLVQEAKGLYEQAIARDSTYALAWAELANVHLWLAEGASDPEAEEEQATVAAERALSLNPDEGMAHRVLGVQARRADPETAQMHFEQAVAANPADSYALGLLAIGTLGLGDEARAIRMAERVVALDPLSVDGLNIAATLHSYVGRHERAIELGRAMVALAPDQPIWGAALASILAAAGEAEEAIQLAQRALEAEPRFEAIRRVLAYAYARSGNRAEAERVFGSLSNRSHAFRGAVEAALGDNDAAFAALERSLAEESPDIYREFPIDNWLRLLHDDPRWEPLVARIRAGEGQD